MTAAFQEVVSKADYVQLIGDNPGITAGEMGDKLGRNSNTVSGKLSQLFNNPGGEEFVICREKFERAKNQFAFRWYTPANAPKNVVLEFPPGFEPPPPAAEEKTAGPRLGIAQIIEYLGKKPGATPHDMAADYGIPPGDASSRLSNAFKSTQGHRLARVEVSGGAGHRSYKWYRAEDLPEEEKARRAEFERLRQEEQARVDAKRAEREAAQAAAEAAERVRIEAEREAERLRAIAEEEAERLRVQAEEAAVQDPATPEAGEPAVQVETEPFPAPAASLAPAPRSLDLGGLLDQVAAAFAGQLVERIKAHLAVELPTLVPQAAPPAPPMPDIAELIAQSAQPAREQKPAREKIVILGLLPIQAGQVSSKYGQFFDLSFWDDENPDRLKALVKSADYVLNHVKHSRHHFEGIVKSVHGGKDKLIRVNGGHSSICDWLLNRMRTIQAEAGKLAA